MTFRLHYPRTTALYFGSGKIVCTGARNPMEARLALMIYVSLIKEKMGLNVNVYQFEIQNIVSSANLGFTLNLHLMQRKNGITSSYEPELFPGLIYRNSNLPAVCLIFDSGRIVITGCRQLTDIEQTFEYIEPLLQQYKNEQTQIKTEEDIDTLSNQFL